MASGKEANIVVFHQERFYLTICSFVCLPDAGKSTIGGQIMSLTGMVDKRTLEKYEREAREKSRESWYLSWALDTNQEGTIVVWLGACIAAHGT